MEAEKAAGHCYKWVLLFKDVPEIHCTTGLCTYNGYCRSQLGITMSKSPRQSPPKEEWLVLAQAMVGLHAWGLWLPCTSWSNHVPEEGCLLCGSWETKRAGAPVSCRAVQAQWQCPFMGHHLYPQCHRLRTKPLTHGHLDIGTFKIQTKPLNWNNCLF